ncbi:MAG TPA: metallophosphoesterase [Flavobacterium sp.]|jgi:hypothetical protein
MKNITNANFSCLAQYAIAVVASFCLGSCATYRAQSGSDVPVIISAKFDDPALISHTFVLVGDAGNADTEQPQQMLSSLTQRLSKSDANTTLLFLGDNIYENGIPPKGSKDRADAEEKLNRQLRLTERFKGKTIFIPGNHDWYSGIAGIKEQERLVTEYFKDSMSFLPRNTCGLEVHHVNDQVVMIVVDSYWFLQDWDKLPEINSGCDIQTREQFYEALENELNENQNKAVLLTVHHPLVTHGSHGGEFPLREHLFPLEQDIPLPGIATLIHLLRKTSGVSVQDIQNKKYNAMARRIKTMIATRKNVVVVSGHDHNLQYMDEDNIRQIISGSGSKNEGARAVGDKGFSYGRNGYAVLQVLKTGGARVSFYGVGREGKEALLAQREPLVAPQKPNVREVFAHFAAVKDTSVYSRNMTNKTKFYRVLWGEHYRRLYGRTIRVRQANLDTLFGGLTPDLSGNDDQSRSITLTTKGGRIYEMRALRKSGARFLQSAAFRDQAVENAFRNTYTDEFILDFYTTAHPYAPLVVSGLAQRIAVSHSNPRLFFIPKQKSLGLFNSNFGDELYLIEEHPTDASRTLRNFGKPSSIIETEEMLANIRRDKKYSVDKDDYIKARLFDMLIGDWDRGPDQWKWGEYPANGKIIYRPIPLNRDQAFTRFDGLLFKIIMKFQPIRHMKSYGKEIDNVKWFNRQAFNLDVALLPEADREDWLRQATYIIENLSDAEIDRAFENLPVEMKDGLADKIKSELKTRKTHLREYATEYFEILRRKVIITGSEGIDRIVVDRNAETTTVQVYQIEDNVQKVVFEHSYDNDLTKELWLYGLGAEDVFEVTGTATGPQIRLMGGSETDRYQVECGKRVKIYDFVATDSDVIDAGSAKMAFSDSYERNSYIFEKPKYNFFSALPLIGFNPDDGIKIGGVAAYNISTFNSYPNMQRHSVRGSFYFATGGYELRYDGLFPDVVGKWDLAVDLLYTSPNFSINFFGLGNETENFEDEVGKDFNRVKIRTIRASPSLQWQGEQGGSAFVRASFERNRVDRTADRFISDPGIVNPEVFQYQNFMDYSGGYRFANYDNVSNPTLGMTFALSGGIKININETGRKVPYAESALGFTYRLSPTGNWVLETMLKGRALFSNAYEFYQAATVGGDADLRGFRNQRFAGKRSFYQSTDLRWNLGKLKNGFGPLYYGLFGGVDYGRVWLKDDTSEKWHQSYGGGVYLNGVNLVTARLSYFQSGDGGRLVFGFLLGF